MRGHAWSMEMDIYAPLALRRGARGGTSVSVWSLIWSAALIDRVSRERTPNGHNHTKHTQECSAARVRAALASPLQPTCHVFAFFLDATTPCTNHL